MTQAAPATMPQAAVYVGRVMHSRTQPMRHRFSYRVFSLLLDLDALPALAGRLKLFSYNRFNLFAFFDRDHGPRDGGLLRPWVERQLAAAGIDLSGGRIFLHCFPRLLGYVFNPISIYFCYHADGRLLAILYEVKNTFGEQHGYLIGVAPDHPVGTPIFQGCSKNFYVSPFLPMDCSYRFRVHAPGPELSILIRQTMAAGEVLIAAHNARAEPISDGTLLRAWLSHPLMNLKVMAGIHWEALRLWRKGAAFYARPAPPPIEVTIVPATSGADFRFSDAA